MWPQEDACKIFGPHESTPSTPDPPSVYHWAVVNQRVYFSPFIFNRRLQHSGTANHWHGHYQNNISAQQIGALPSVLTLPHQHHHHHHTISPGLWRYTPKWKQKSWRKVGPVLLRSVSGLWMVYMRILLWLENVVEVSLVSVSAVHERADCR